MPRARTEVLSAPSKESKPVAMCGQAGDYQKRKGLRIFWRPQNVVGPPYAQLKGSWSSMKNGKPLFHHVLQCVSCWKKELPDGDCRQGRRDYTKCPGTRSRGTRAGDRCYPTASKVH